LPVIVGDQFLHQRAAHPVIRLQIVGEGLDVADDWIAEQATSRDIVITNDIPLATAWSRKARWPSRPTASSSTPIPWHGAGDAHLMQGFKRARPSPRAEAVFGGGPVEVLAGVA